MNDDEKVYCCRQHGNLDKMKVVNDKKTKGAKLRMKLKKNIPDKIVEIFKISSNADLVKLNLDPYLIDQGYAEKECLLCDHKFLPSNQKQVHCNRCHLLVKCDVCGKKFKTVSLNAKLCEACAHAEHMKKVNSYKREHGLGVFNKEWQEKFGSLGRDGPNFRKKNGILEFLDRSKHEYVPWDQFKGEFMRKMVDTQLVPDGFAMMPTFRNQESKTWLGAKSAFEKLLLDENVEWFVYIKYALMLDGKLIPLVVGKSGSYAVNKAGFDVDFGEFDPDDEGGVNDTPARRMIHENGWRWCKTQIAVHVCESEHDAHIFG